MKDLLQKFSRWEGTAAELAALLLTLTPETGLENDSITANERLVRNYVQLGILRKPERRGKEAYFGVRQIIEYLAARILLNDGWPLAKIAEMTSEASIDELTDLLPRQNIKNRAQNLVEQFKQRSGIIDNDTCRHPISYCRKRPTVISSSHNNDLPSPLPNKLIHSKRRDVVCLELTSWCHLYADIEGIENMEPDTAELLGNALTELLKIEHAKKGDR
ncbi:hypothetical protein [Solidesulfovibrio magneticus]|uniref:HTH merR-type domain-containing protein n=1 Tax=Solidesulfovibrio magneticus (strain ATCC 700980 / DSM 13731 / RS-1) TaxID=573370 RepID=C4XPW7_SOLM1|nr:hypothetical protein [Solidesulfovibrio magneticus]BAH77667.1 hypothetical protein DMR_41760 [Solidesulfovibrio magneticus RS-1]